LAVGEGGAKAGMEFHGAGGADDFGEVGGIDAAAGENRDAVGCGGDEIGNDGGTLLGGGFAAGGEKAGGAGLDDGFEGFVEVGRFVEGAMECDGKRAGDSHQFARAFDVDGIVGVQDAEDEAVHFAGFGEVDVVAHLGEFGLGVEKVATAGPDHSEDGDFDGGAGAVHELGARSDATDRKVGAEFDAVCAAAFGGDGGSERFDGNFEKRAQGGHEMY